MIAGLRHQLTVLKLVLPQFGHCGLEGEWSNVFMYTTSFISKELQYKPIDKNNITITLIGVPMVENNNLYIVYIDHSHMLHFKNFVS